MATIVAPWRPQAWNRERRERVPPPEAANAESGLPSNLSTEQPSRRDFQRSRSRSFSTGDIGFNITQDKVHVHGLQAAITHSPGFDHTRLTCRQIGGDFRLTGVAGNVAKKMLA